MAIIKKSLPYSLLFFILIISISGCSSSSGSEESDKSEKVKINSEVETEIKSGNAESSFIITMAETEQKNTMYSPLNDTSYLYWLDNQMLITYGSTKCNIFALNVLQRSGFKTPDENTLCADLFDTTYLTDILPVIEINNFENALSGDLVIWINHVIIFESLLLLNESYYAVGWWAGTRNPDNGDNILNNVCHGKYKLEGEYIIRRPLRK